MTALHGAVRTNILAYSMCLAEGIKMWLLAFCLASLIFYLQLEIFKLYIEFSLFGSCNTVIVPVFTFVILTSTKPAG